MQQHQQPPSTLNDFATAITDQKEKMEQVHQDLQKNKSECERLSKVLKREEDQLRSLQEGSTGLKFKLKAERQQREIDQLAKKHAEEQSGQQQERDQLAKKHAEEQSQGF